jgi:hypothetical protein
MQMAKDRNLLRGFRDRDLAAYVKVCLDAGATLQPTGGTHAKLKMPNGSIVILSTTQHSGRATQNAIATIRRNGGPDDRKGKSK